MTVLATQLGYSIAPRRVTVLPGKIRRLDPRTGKFRVIAGCGWLAVNGRDTIVTAGSSFELPADCRDVPLISALANTALVLEFSRR